MSKRLVVLFFPVPRADNMNPRPITLLRCNPTSPDDLVKKCRGDQLHPELTHPQGRGQILVGREHEHHIINQDARHPNAVSWEGVQKSGDFPRFLLQHTTQFFSQAAQT